MGRLRQKTDKRSSLESPFQMLKGFKKYKLCLKAILCWLKPLKVLRASFSPWAMASLYFFFHLNESLVSAEGLICPGNHTGSFGMQARWRGWGGSPAFRAGQKWAIYTPLQIVVALLHEILLASSTRKSGDRHSWSRHTRRCRLPWTANSMPNLYQWESHFWILARKLL